MHKLFIFCLALVMALGCVGITPRYTRTPTQQARINDAVVALVDPAVSERTGLLHLYCSGAFIDRYRVITAAHCVAGQDTVYLVTRRDFLATNELLTEDTTLHPFRVSRRDQHNDLALLVAVGEDLTPHSVFRVARSAPTQGENVIVMGHPLGLAWSLTAGVVSYERRPAWDGLRNDPEGLYSPIFIQHAAQAEAGNSGGVLLNHRNEIVGVVVQRLPHINHLSMSVHTDVLNTFLQSESLTWRTL